MVKIKKQEESPHKYLCRKCGKGLLSEHEKCGLCNAIMHSEKGMIDVFINEPTESESKVIRRTKVHGRKTSKRS